MSQDEEDQDFGIPMGVINKGYGVINQLEPDQEEGQQILTQNIFPTPTEHRILYKGIGKGAILMKIMIFGLIAILFSILIILFVANLNKYQYDYDNDKYEKSQYSTDPLLNKQNKLQFLSKY